MKGETRGGKQNIKVLLMASAYIIEIIFNQLQELQMLQEQFSEIVFQSLMHWAMTIIYWNYWDTFSKSFIQKYFKLKIGELPLKSFSVGLKMKKLEDKKLCTA